MPGHNELVLKLLRNTKCLSAIIHQPLANHNFLRIHQKQKHLFGVEDPKKKNVESLNIQSHVQPERPDRFAGEAITQTTQTAEELRGQTSLSRGGPADWGH